MERRRNCSSFALFKVLSACRDLRFGTGDESIVRSNQIVPREVAHYQPAGFPISSGQTRSSGESRNCSAIPSGVPVGVVLRAPGHRWLWWLDHKRVWRGYLDSGLSLKRTQRGGTSLLSDRLID